mgnify:CR=1 FL=1
MSTTESHWNTRLLLNSYMVSWLSCVSNVRCTLIHGFFRKHTISRNSPSMFTMKLSKFLCLECSTCAMFFNSSFTVSIIALLRRSSLSETLIKAPFMLLLSFVISCMPPRISAGKASCRYILCQQPAYHIGIQ